MRQAWRWFGPADPVTLREIRQAGATEVVTALHHLHCGELWTESEIAKRLRRVAWDQALGRPTGLQWTVVESLPVHESIKTRDADYGYHLEVYKQSLSNLAGHGLRTVCYNFMPVLDWTRTDLNFELEDGSRVLHCDLEAIAAFDLFILKRPEAAAAYSQDILEGARELWGHLGVGDRKRLADAILLGLPGTVEDLTVEDFGEALRRYEGITAEQLRENLFAFLNDIMPLCERLGIRMAIHPDDPPRSIFGLPRIMSTEEDVQSLLDAVPSPHSGLTLCTGSFGGRKDNDPAAMFERFAPRVHFAHLRNVDFVAGTAGSFYESSHLQGAVDMVRVMRALIAEEERRRSAGLAEWQVPIRPDHGRLLDCDKDRGCYAGYSYAGRLMGLAELRGLEMGLRAALGCPLT